VKRPSFPQRPPPWWPQTEVWPPESTRSLREWHGMRRRFSRRMGCGLVLFVLFGSGMIALATWLLSRLVELVNIPAGATVPLALGIFVVGMLALLFTLARVLRRAALPVGDLLDAAGRVTTGDYSVRVREGGPREVRALVRAFNTMAARLQTNDEQRRSLMADVTHELRTPITIIQGNLEGMLDGIYPADREHIASILDETHTLSRVVDDLRTLSVAENGALKLELEVSDLGSLLEDTAAAFREQAKAAGVTLVVEAAPGLAQVEVDPLRIREVVGNLVVNSLRYTPAGGEIRLRCWMEAGDMQFVRAAVSDTGTGVSPEDLPHIFDRFYKSADSRGSGLGLAICKGLVAAHGGEISAQSQPGGGTTIEFTLPK
jgi:two-component system sensor histidine kinase BaeS